MPDDDEPTLVSAAPQRKLAVILAAVVAGYSRLMERDEEGTHQRLQGLLREVVRAAAETHRGRIFKTAGGRIHGRIRERHRSGALPR
ncbi:adenylate/guanylate cyclase domain-containing protein [Sinorhizobium fredii]|uniref:adenylate/guanylate cyclase domain-containing protein n=1 Tax=Rhizobium fredii TaxID=380 RepID=UPI001872172D|nr:adenylate/guanylate cyclase domain-containing protein [Sinorhizobium fredii]